MNGRSLVPESKLQQQQQQQGGYLTSHQQLRAAEMLSLLATLKPLKSDVSLTPSQLEQQLLMKLVINCCANPLTAILHCKNGGLLHNPPAKSLMADVVSECKEVFGAKVAGSKEELLDMVEHVVGFNSSNYNSMLQDVVAGVPTEVLLLNGYVVQEGRRRGLACPVNEMLCRMVQAREAVSADMRTVEQMVPHM
jgi:2-dehydropantoate 2-reductase